ncbi:hypothetical protein HpBhutan61_14350 [Helicobacter pylori]
MVKDLSTLELLKNRLHFVAHKICDGKKLEKLQQEINDTYTLIYHDLRHFKDDHLEGFLKHFVRIIMARKGILKRGYWRWNLTLIKDIPTTPTLVTNMKK